MSAGLGATDAGTLIDAAVKRLAPAGIESPRREARLLLGHVLEADPGRFTAWPETACSDEQRAYFEALVERRAAREPLSHLTGVREFWSLDFHVTADVLDPRPDSETLVAEALNRLPGREAAPRILDIGTGSGCLLLAVLSERPNASGLGIDISPAALEIARRNAADLGLAARAQFQQSDWLKTVTGRFDLILCNPPYIPDAEIETLQPEVRDFEPRLALGGGPDGLAPYKNLIPELPEYLAPDGVALFELGVGQASVIAEIAIQCGVETLAQIEDLSGRTRCLAFGIRG